MKKKINKEDLDNGYINGEKHKIMHYEFLNAFAHLEFILNYCVSSYFTSNEKAKMELTDLVLSRLNSRDLFKIFCQILKKKKIDTLTDEDSNKTFESLKELRNTLAHSFYIPTNNFKAKKGIVVTKIRDSKLKGYRQDISIVDYESKWKSLQNMIGSVQKIMYEHFYKK